MILIYKLWLFKYQILNLTHNLSCRTFNEIIQINICSSFSDFPEQGEFSGQLTISMWILSSAPSIHNLIAYYAVIPLSPAGTFQLFDPKSSLSKNTCSTHAGIQAPHLKLFFFFKISLI